VVFSPDGQTVASGSADNTVRLWDAATGELVETLDTHSASVNTVAFSPDGTILAAGSNDNTIKLWYLGKDREPESLSTDAAVSSVTFSPDGNTLAAGSGSKVRFWRKTGAEGSRELDLLASLERRARKVAEVDRQGQQRIIDELETHLSARVPAGLQQRDIILAASTARRIQESDNRELAAGAFRSFAKVIAASKDKELRSLAESWEAMAP
jgi:predicted NACHT family NTPase